MFGSPLKQGSSAPCCSTPQFEGLGVVLFQRGSRQSRRVINMPLRLGVVLFYSESRLKEK